MDADDKQFLVDERAAILEFDAGMKREAAEELARSRADEMEWAWDEMPQDLIDLHNVQGDDDG